MKKIGKQQLIIDYLSDLHLDEIKHKIKFMGNDGEFVRYYIEQMRESLRNQNKETGQALIIAGDLSHYPHLTALFLYHISKDYEKVFFVLGNHDYYVVKKKGEVTINSTEKIETLKNWLSKIQNTGSSFQKIHLLDSSVVTYRGFTIGGMTSWPYYEKGTSEWRKYCSLLPDNSFIKGFNIKKKAKEEECWYKETAHKIDVLITHYPPIKSYKHSFFNNTIGFLKPLNELPIYVFCGHTHEKYKIKQQESIFFNNSKSTEALEVIVEQVVLIL